MRKLLRLARIVGLALRYRLDLVLLEAWTGKAYRGRRAPRGVRIRRTLETLGPIFVKFGQILSVRPDLIPEDVTTELAALRDHVPPFPGRTARAIVERALESPVAEAFEEFDETPLASASIAQVHTARLAGGVPVVVKVVRPGLEKAIRRDAGLLRLLARLAERFVRSVRWLRPVAVVDEFEKILLDELDMQREGSAASTLRRNFADTDLLEVPRVHWSHTRRDVLVLDRIEGIPVDDVEAVRRAGIDLERLAERGTEIFFTQVFRHNFFHADMHPGNIFVARNAARYVAVDFGIMGSLGAEDQRYLAENLLAFFRSDYRRVAELHVASGWVPAHVRVEELESAIRAVCEPILHRPLKDISAGHLLVRLFRTARRFEMEVQPQLVLLQKTLLHVEGLGRQLYPDLDLWATGRPFLEQWMRERVSVPALMERVRERFPRWMQLAPEIPELVHELLRREAAAPSAPSASSRTPGAPAARTALAPPAFAARAGDRVALAIAGAGLVIAGAVLLGHPPADHGLGPGLAVGGLGAACLAGAVFRR